MKDIPFIKIIFRLVESIILVCFIQGVGIISFIFGHNSNKFTFNIDTFVLIIIFFLILFNNDLEKVKNKRG